MIYPNNFEHKLGFDEIRRLLKERCLSTLGKEKVDEITFSTNADAINEQLAQVREFRRLKDEKDNFPMQYFFDVRESIMRIRLENTHLEEDEVWDLRRSLETIANIVRYLEHGAVHIAWRPVLWFCNMHVSSKSAASAGNTKMRPIGKTPF